MEKAGTLRGTKAEKRVWSDIASTCCLSMSRDVTRFGSGRRIVIRILTVAGCAVLATPTLAQQQPDSVAPPMRSQMPPEQAPPARTTPAAPDAAQIVAAEFPVHDANRSGLLDATEFAHWARALRAASPGQPPMAEADLQAWTVAAFDPMEMTAFLTAAGS